MLLDKCGIRKIIYEIAEVIGDYVFGIIWYGSSLRNPETANDIDILIILRVPAEEVEFSIKEKLKKYLNKNYRDIPFDISLKTYYWFKGIKHPIIIGMVAEGYEIIKDTDGKLAKILSAIEKILREKKVKRTKLKGFLRIDGTEHWTYVYENKKGSD